MAEAIVITEAWPFVIIVPPASYDLAWIEDLDKRFKGVFARRKKFAVITDTTGIESLPGARERGALAKWAGSPEIMEMQKLYNVGSSTVLANALLRGAMQAMYWVWTPPTPQHAARDFDEAWRFCEDMLSKAAVPMEPGPTELKTRALVEIARRRPAALRARP